MNIKKISIFISIIIIPLCLTGLSCSKNKNTISNVPFELLDQSDFTLEKSANETTEPLVLAVDKQDLFNKFYKNIRQNAADSKITVNSDTELIIIALRGKNGSCNNADITIKKISQEDNTIKVETVLDNNQPIEVQKCDLTMNPYVIVKINKSAIQYKSNLKIELINSATQKILNSSKINSLPGFLKQS